MNPVLMQLIQRLGPGVARLSESAQAALARSLGLQTPAAQQASSRLMEPGTAERAMSAIRASGPGGTNPMLTAGATAGTALGAGMATPPGGGAPQMSPDREALFAQLNRDPDTMARMAAVNRAKEMVNLPEYEGARAPMYMDKESYGLPDAAYRQLADLQKSAGKSDAQYRREGATPARAVTQAAASPNREDPKSFFGRLFSGPEYQSTGQAVIERQQGPMRAGEDRPKTVLNWGDAQDPRDFFRADKAMQQLQKDKEEFVGRADGGKVGSGAGGKDAAIHKALEIIHHLLSRR